MRDHLLGYPPAAHEAAYQEEAQAQGYDVFEDYDSEYPFGMPERVHAENLARWDNAPRRKARVAAQAFEREVAPNPDGTRTPAREAKRITSLGLMSVLRGAMDAHADSLVKNVMRNNALMFHKGISCKPPHGGYLGEVSVQPEAERISDVFMAGYKAARQDETEALKAEAPMRADLWAAQRREQLIANDEARAHFQAQVERIKQGGGLDALAQPLGGSCIGYAGGYDILAVHPGDVLTSAKFEFRQASVPCVISSL